MATKTTNIEVKVDETLAAAIAPRIALASRLGLTPSGDTTRRSRRGMRPATPTGRSGSMSPSRKSRPSGRESLRLPRWESRSPPVGVGVSLGGGRGFPRWG